MLRLTESRADEPLKPRTPGGASSKNSAPGPLPFDAAEMAEHALDQAERRMKNLLDLVRRFDLDAPGEGPRVA